MDLYDDLPPPKKQKKSKRVATESVESKPLAAISTSIGAQAQETTDEKCIRIAAGLLKERYIYILSVIIVSICSHVLIKYYCA